MSQDNVVIKEAKDEVLYLTLNRPEKGNSIEDTMISFLTNFFQNKDNFSSFRAVIIGGSGKHFCTGADLSWMGDEPTESQSRTLSEMFFSVSNCTIPTIATVHGACLGGGMGLAAACDFVLASNDSTFGFTEVKMGLVPALISPYVISRIGIPHTRELFLTGSKFGPDKAKSICLVREICEDLNSSALSLISELKSGGPVAQATIKELLHQLPEWNSDSYNNKLSKLITELRKGKEGQEGISAFLEKRKPSWNE